jgi:DNA invertase Pin-like site-specific DNA recombinase
VSKITIAYVRVSTEEQTVENQIQFLNVWATSNGYKISQIFEDVSTSGTVNFFDRQAPRP